MAEGDGPKIQVDSDWKAQAQAEKQRLAEQAKASEAKRGPSAKPGAAAGPAGDPPPASFETLVEAIARTAALALGGIPDPRTGQRVVHLPLARQHIDMLAVLEEKTKGNLSDEETSVLANTLYQLRSTYIQLSAAQRNR